MRVVFGIEDARRVLCEGRGLDLDDLPQQVSEGIERIFGEPLTPSQVVERIVRRVRSEGDAAVREYSQLLDGVAPDDMEVPRAANRRRSAMGVRASRGGAGGGGGAHSQLP